MALTGGTERASAKKLQVFISSPFGGMEDYRRAVMEGVVRAGHVPVLLENFSFRNEQDIPVIVNALEDCQVYILLLGHRYGSIVSASALAKVRSLCHGLEVPEGVSFTELEYRLAKHYEFRGEKDKRLAVFTILIDREQVKEQREADRPAHGAEEHREQEHARLDVSFWAFYDMVSAEKTFGRSLDVRAPDLVKATLPLQIQLALQGLDATSLQSWIPEPRGIPAELIVAISQNPLTQAIIGRLGMFGSLDKRLAREPELKQRAGEFFWTKYGGAICAEEINLFFESGSTIAFLVGAIGTQIAGRHKVASNNVLAHLLLWLVNRGICEMFPNTTPDPADQFGATFGEHIDKLYAERSLPGRPPEPDYTGKRLDCREKSAIDETLGEPAAPNHWPGKTLLLGAISGIQMGEVPRIIWGKGTEKSEELETNIRQCRGFHVGSYKNKLFKRFMYETKLPLMVFLDESKVDKEIEAGRCHFIFDREERTWEEFTSSYPLAFCVGCHSTTLDRCADVFERANFEIVRDNGTFAHRAFIARNAEFVRQFGPCS